VEIYFGTHLTSVAVANNKGITRFENKFLVSIDRSEVPTPYGAVRLLLKFRFRVVLGASGARINFLCKPNGKYLAFEPRTGTGKSKNSTQKRNLKSKQTAP
jgi:hypothetical protein